MFKKTITYTDFNGTERVEDFYFHLSEAEVIEMELSTEGGMTAYIEKISKTKDLPKLIAIFKELILKTYGEKSPDGKRFVKTEQLSLDFQHTEAYSKLFMELATDAEAASTFVNSVIPNKRKDEPKTPQDHNIKSIN